MAVKKALEKALNLLKIQWYDFIDTIVSGTCACHHAVTLHYESVIKTTCDPSDADLSMFGGGGDQCLFSVDKYSETIDMPVFFSGTRFPVGQDFYIPHNKVLVFTTKDNSDKLLRASRITVDSQNYIKDSDRIPCGWDDTYVFYQVMFKECV